MPYHHYVCFQFWPAITSPRAFSELSTKSGNWVWLLAVFYSTPQLPKGHEQGR